MRELVRPCLFIIARLGLFLAVVAWVVGQWWSSAFRISHIAVATDPNVWSFSSDNRLPPRFDYCIWRNQDDAITAQNLVWYRRWNVFPGVSARRWLSLPWILIKHWFIVTVLLTFNVTLHFIYRRRPEAEPCEN